MALLCLTSDWYRNRMSIVDSNPSMSFALFVFFISCAKLLHRHHHHHHLLAIEFKANEMMKRNRIEKKFCEPFEPTNTSRTLQTPRNIKNQTSRSENAIKTSSNKTTRTATHPTRLFDWYVIISFHYEMIFVTAENRWV